MHSMLLVSGIQAALIPFSDFVLSLLAARVNATMVPAHLLYSVHTHVQLLLGKHVLHTQNITTFPRKQYLHTRVLGILIMHVWIEG